MKTRCLLFVLFVFGSCNNDKIPKDVIEALEESGKARVELENVIQHYKKLGNDQKLRAAYFLIKNIPEQYHYAGKRVEDFRKVFYVMDSLITVRGEVDYLTVWDSLQPKSNARIQKVYDRKIITAQFLINNIDNAFKAWDYPWAKDLSFDDFCNYLLPYKLKNETPEEWRSFFQQKYKWVLDSIKNKSDAKEACTIINNDLKRWFYITKFNSPFDLSFSDLIKLRSGRCVESTQLTAYAMRAMGIPVTLDYVNAWANRNSAHDWNGLIYKDKTIPFLGTEVNPGVYKIEYPMPGSLKSKRAKVFRRTFSEGNHIAPVDKDWSTIPKIFRDTRFSDVTNEYIPVSNVTLSINKKFMNAGIAYLCVFNRPSWRPQAWTYIEGESITFNDMGRDIVYLPTVINDSTKTPVNFPFVLRNDGTLNFIKVDTQKKITFTIDRKYPVGDDNKITPGNHYELFYWDNAWLSISKLTAESDTLTFSGVPDNGLLWLKNLDEGAQERIFRVNNGKIVWW